MKAARKGRKEGEARPWHGAPARHLPEYRARLLGKGKLSAAVYVENERKVFCLGWG